MGRYRHLSIEEREEIMCLRREGEGVGQIAREIGRDKSTVSRELGRNSCRAGSDRPYYRASAAQRRYEARRLRCRRPRLLDDPGLGPLVQRKILEDRWSPEQISDRLRLERGRGVVSASTIYRAVNGRRLDTPELRGTARGMRARLRRRGKRRRRRGEEERGGKIRVSHELSERPGEACRRERPGDWEGDTVVGRGSGPCLVTLVDRRSRLLAGGRAAARTKDAVADVEVATLRGQPCETVTPDRGKEFADHARVTREVGAEFYFCTRTTRGRRARSRTPTASSGSTSPRAPTSPSSPTGRWRRCAMRSTTGLASAWDGGRRGRSTTGRRCTCYENSRHNDRDEKF